MADKVNHPTHYNSSKYECIDVMVDVYGTRITQHFCLLNAFKYIWHTQQKNGAEDIAKAIWYLRKWEELEAKHENSN